MSSAPVASKLVLLSELDECAQGDKVRFLGCVNEYILKDATLRLKHDHLPCNPPIIANVNIEHVLESVKRVDVDIGTWLNVIGYVERRMEKGISVQALAVWDAGHIDLGAYERAVEKRKEVE